MVSMRTNTDMAMVMAMVTDMVTVGMGKVEKNKFVTTVIYV